MNIPKIRKYSRKTEDGISVDEKETEIIRWSPIKKMIFLSSSDVYEKWILE